MLVVGAGNSGAEIAVDLANGGASAGSGSPCARSRASFVATRSASRLRCSESRRRTGPVSVGRSAGALEHI